MKQSKIRMMVVCAHPDDADLMAGGLAVKHAKLGNTVKFVSLTNGNAGHHIIGGKQLAERRYEEAQQAAKIGGFEYQIWDVDDGTLIPSLENRRKLIEQIRDFKPDMVLTHRPNDYHPDHRYTSQLVQDAAYLLTVPNVCSLTRHMDKMPVIAYLYDNFQKPYPFLPDMIVSIDDVIDTKIKMLDSHVSQMYEWLPYNDNNSEPIPEERNARLVWLKNEWNSYLAGVADKYRTQLINRYGEEKGESIKYAEAFEFCEYGSILDKKQIDILFPL